MGLQIASELEFTHIELNLDSLAVVHCLTNKTNGNSLGRNFTRCIRSLLELDWAIKIKHSYRESNKVTNGLANLGCTFSNETSVISFSSL